MAQQCTAEECETLRKREELLHRTISDLQQTIARQERLIQTLLRSPLAPRPTNGHPLISAPIPPPSKQHLVSAAPAPWSTPVPSRPPPARPANTSAIPKRPTSPFALIAHPPLPRTPTGTVPQPVAPVIPPAVPLVTVIPHPRPLSPSPSPTTSPAANSSRAAPTPPTSRPTSTNSAHPTPSIRAELTASPTPPAFQARAPGLTSITAEEQATGTYPPFPNFGRKWLPKTLWWWWYPKWDHDIPEPLRDWTQEQRRATAGKWQKAELIVRGWHIMKGHDLMEHSSDQAERMELADLRSDVEAYMLRWGETHTEACGKIRDYLRDHQPPYKWAPGKRVRSSARSTAEEGRDECDEDEPSGEGSQRAKKAKVGEAVLGDQGVKLEVAW